MSGAPAIEARGLTRRYGSVTVVRDVSLSLARGSKTALVGANGAGKTTLLGMLSTLIAPSGGEASINGSSLAKNPAALRRSIGVLAHSPMLYEQLSPLENLTFFAGLYNTEDAEARVEELLRAVGLWLRRHEPVAVLSRGYHQRLAVARALAHRPPVLLLDEPETGLDAEGIEVLDRLMLTAPGVTVLAATHRLERVEAWAEAVIRLDAGRVVEETALGGARAAVAAVAGAAS